MQVSPFTAQGHFTTVHNALFDVVMPSLGPNAWKVLCAILRETVGWSRDRSQLNHAALLSLTGISSKATLTAALDELLTFKSGDKSCPLITVEKGAKWEAHGYAVNRKARLKWNPSSTGNKAEMERALSGTETVPPGTETVPDEPSTETVPSGTETVPDALVQKLYHGSGTETVPSYRKETSINTETRKKERRADARSALPAILAFRETADRFPAKHQYDQIIESLGETPNRELLTRCWREWCKRGYSPTSIAWATDWYHNPALMDLGKPKARPISATHNQGGTGKLVQ